MKKIFSFIILLSTVACDIHGPETVRRVCQEELSSAVSKAESTAALAFLPRNFIRSRDQAKMGQGYVELTATEWNRPCGVWLGATK